MIKKIKHKLNFKNCSCVRVCVSLCTTVVHNTAQNSSDNLLFNPPDNHHCSGAVYWTAKEDGWVRGSWLIQIHPEYSC